MPTATPVDEPSTAVSPRNAPGADNAPGAFLLQSHVHSGLFGSATSLIVRANDMMTRSGRAPRPPKRRAIHAPTQLPATFAAAMQRPSAHSTFPPAIIASSP